MSPGPRHKPLRTHITEASLPRSRLFRRSDIAGPRSTISVRAARYRRIRAARVHEIRSVATGPLRLVGDRPRVGLFGMHLTRLHSRSGPRRLVGRWVDVEERLVVVVILPNPAVKHLACLDAEPTESLPWRRQVVVSLFALSLLVVPLLSVTLLLILIVLVCHGE